MRLPQMLFALRAKKTPHASLVDYAIVAVRKEIGLHRQQVFARLGVRVECGVRQSETMDIGAVGPDDSSYPRSLDRLEHVLASLVPPVEPVAVRISYPCARYEGDPLHQAAVARWIDPGLYSGDVFTAFQFDVGKRSGIAAAPSRGDHFCARAVIDVIGDLQSVQATPVLQLDFADALHNMGVGRLAILG